MAATITEAPARPLVADLYLRESSSRRRSRTGKDIRGASKSISEQESDGRRDIERVGAVLGETFRDRDRGASQFSKGTRDDWERLITKLESPNRPDMLVTWECSRGTRDLEVYVALRAICRRTGVKWMYNGRVYDLSDTSDAFITGLDVLSAEREAGMTHDRVMRATRFRRSEGRPHGRLLYGYERRYDRGTGEYLEQIPHTETAPIVREIFRAIAEDGITLNRLATKLNKANVPTPRGAPAWRALVLRRMIENKGYLGHRTHNGEVVYENAWTPLIDEATWWAAQARIAQTPDVVRESTRPDTTVKYLLSGLMRCGVCGGSVVMSLGGKVGRGGKYATYHCNARYCVGRSRKHLDAYITEVVLSMVESEPEIGKPTDDPRIGDLMKEIEGQRAQLASFEEQAISGQLSAAAYARIEQRLAPKIADAEQRLKTLRTRTPLPDLGGRTVRDAWNTPEDQGGLSLADKRTIIRSLVAIRILPTGSGKRFDPDAIEITRIDLLETA